MRCEAVVPASTYAASHRCEKDRRVRRVPTPSGDRALCPHHRGALARGSALRLA